LIFQNILESLSGYKVPSKASELMGDFYVLELLYSRREELDIDDKEFIENAVQNLLPKLKKELLEDVKQIVYDETYGSDDDLGGLSVYEAKHWFEKLAERKTMYEDWVNICKGWIQLEKAKIIKDIFLAIDNVYHLQHLNGSIMNKMPKYSHNAWAENLLELKYESRNPWKLYDYVSADLKYFVPKVFYKLGFGSRENPV
jgi:hypothetical protein